MGDPAPCGAQGTRVGRAPAPPPRMTQACHRKCVPPHYKDPELSKGESVCLDRCVAKYLDVHERMGKKLTELSLQDEELLKRMQQGTGTA
uniref:Mitochondrial import inner membrane translocase subunit n=1 Tax=Anser cygnoides TaxID=8845 RepID=A0A8B9IK38_ANSCY